MLGRILIVDDDPSVLALLSELLDPDYAVSAVTSGEEALSLLKSSSVDLALLDLIMPDMDGLALCEALKQNPATADIPVMFITASEDPQSEEQVFDAGAIDFIPKPIKPKVVKARVRQQMHNYLYLQFLERLLKERNTTIETLRAETQELLKSIGINQ